MSGLTFYTIGVTFASGILFRSFFDGGHSLIFIPIIVAIGALALWRMSTDVKQSPLFLLALASLCFVLGAARFEYADSHNSPLEEGVGERIAYEGVIVREPEVRERSTHLYVRLEEYDETILVTADRFGEYGYGDRVSVAGELSIPESFETEYERTFNYPGYLKARGVSYTMHFAQVEVVGHGEGNPAMRYLLAGKWTFIASLSGALTEPEAGLAQGILLGVRRALGDNLEAAFRSVGIIHIVVLSGYNVMIIAEAMMRTLSFVFRPFARMVVGIVVIAAFALVVGLSATVVRASVMAALALVARATGRRYAVMRALVLAAAMMLLINPYLITFDPGFQLSFLATLGLIALAPLIEARLIRVPTRFHLREVLTATVATQLFILPFLAYQIGTVSVVSLLANLLVLPVVPYTMFFAFIAGVAGIVSTTFGMVSGFPAYLLLTYIVNVAEKLSALPFASYSVPPIPFWAVVLCYACIGCAMFVFDVRKKQRIVTESGAKGVGDPYADWVIEEESEKTPGARNAPGA